MPRPNRPPRQVPVVDGRPRPTLKKFGVATVETDTKIFRKARVDMDPGERTVAFLSQQRTVLEQHEDVDLVKIDETANPKQDWTEKWEVRRDGVVLAQITAVRTCNCGGTRVITKPA